MRLLKPTERNTQAREVRIGDIRLYFSYETLIGVSGHNGLRRIAKSYSNITRKHMREMGIWRAAEMDNDALNRYAEISIMTSLMAKHLPVEETDNAT